MPTALLLGAGLVVGPLVRYLSEHGVDLVVGSRRLGPAEALIKGCKNAKAVRVDLTKAEDDALLEDLIRTVDVVLSLVPWIHHTKTARLAVKHGVHFCTTSYVSDDMRALDAEAKAKGIILFNECGVDPGLDHMSAKKIIDEVHAAGGKIVSFTSFCGGLPAPEDNNNPFGYKLSWSPRGVLLASRNNATFLRDGKVVTIPGKDLFDNFEIMHVPGTDVVFEGYPNRDSTSYTATYGIPEAKTCIRGTFRNQGWCQTLKKMADIGYLSLDPYTFDGEITFADLTCALTKAQSGQSAKAAVAAAVGLKESDAIIERMEWIGLFDTARKIPQDTPTVLDAVCIVFNEKLKYAPGERDWLVMHHEFGIEYSNGKKEKRTSTLLDYGLPNGDTSMSRTVSLPFAVAVKMLLDGKIKLRGVQTPVVPELYNPILEEVAKMGIVFDERTESM